MGCATGMVKYLVFIFNLIFALAGLVLLVVGVLYKLNFNNITTSVGNGAIGVAPMSMIVIGAIVFIIAFFGCCGAVKESTCMLTTYAVILIVIFVLQIAIGVYAFLQVKDDHSNDFRKEITRDLQKTFDRYSTDKAAQDSFNLLQHSLQCCGVQNPNDWNNSNLPSSCCKDNKNPCHIADRDSFEEGCANKLYRTLKDNMQTIGYIALGLCATELIAAIFSLCLTSSIKNERRRGYA